MIVNVKIKKVVFSVLFLMILASGSSCVVKTTKIEEKSYPWTIGQENSLEFCDTVSITIANNSLTGSGAEFLFENISDGVYGYGADFFIQIEIDGKWYEIEWYDPEKFKEITPIWPLWAKELPARETIIHKDNWRAMYGNLSAGKYRYIKNFWLLKESSQESDSLSADIYSACSFAIE